MLLAVVAPSSFHADSLLIVVLLVAASAFPVVDANASGRALLALERPRAVALSTGFAAVFNIVLNLALVPTLKIEGSALATVLAFTAQALVARLLLRRDVVISFPPLRQLSSVLLGVLLAWLSTTLPSHGLWIGVRCLAGALLAVVVYVVLFRGGVSGRHRDESPDRRDESSLKGQL